VITESEANHRYAFLCPQCGCPTHGSSTTSGEMSSFCEDCLSDRDIDDPIPAA